MEKSYSIQVKREILVSVEIKAESLESALEKYYNGNYEQKDEEVLDSTDTEAPSVLENTRSIL